MFLSNNLTFCPLTELFLSLSTNFHEFFVKGCLWTRNNRLHNGSRIILHSTHTTSIRQTLSIGLSARWRHKLWLRV